MHHQQLNISPGTDLDIWNQSGCYTIRNPVCELLFFVQRIWDSDHIACLDELTESRAEILIILGDQPLKWFARYFGSFATLSRYGNDTAECGRTIRLLPQVHSRQAGRLGGYSSAWAALLDRWVAGIASGIL
ncbi:MAG TPA: hypothetical protein PLV45_13030 [bacterium]|nr:hypothetical protein [bacterium]